MKTIFKMSPSSILLVFLLLLPCASECAEKSPSHIISKRAIEKLLKTPSVSLEKKLVAIELFFKQRGDQDPLEPNFKRLVDDCLIKALFSKNTPLHKRIERLDRFLSLYYGKRGSPEKLSSSCATLTLEVLSAKSVDLDDKLKMASIFLEHSEDTNKNEVLPKIRTFIFHKTILGRSEDKDITLAYHFATKYNIFPDNETIAALKKNLFNPKNTKTRFKTIINLLYLNGAYSIEFMKKTLSFILTLESPKAVLDYWSYVPLAYDPTKLDSDFKKASYQEKEKYCSNAETEESQRLLCEFEGKLFFKNMEFFKYFFTKKANTVANALNNMALDDKQVGRTFLDGVADMALNEKTSDSELLDFLNALRMSQTALDYFLKKEIQRLHERVSKTKDQKLRREIESLYKDAVFSEKFDFISATSLEKLKNGLLEKAAFKTLTNKSIRGETRIKAFWRLTRYDDFFKDLQLPKGYFDKYLEIARNPRENKQLRLLVFYYFLKDSQNPQAKALVKDVKRNPAKYPILKKAISVE
jgi:hypothetical protein